jgi:hypothetical protein
LARSAGANTRIVFADASPQVPDATFRVGQIFRFLNANRTSPTAALEVA